MFKNWGPSEDGTHEPITMKSTANNIATQNTNTILKGSKLIGDINVTCDLELSGDIEGNITSLKDSSIVIKGTCKGNIDTREGSVRIDGKLNGGNITAGSDVIIAGIFNGGTIKSQGRVLIDGDFEGSLDAHEIEIGPNAKGRADIVYRDCISVAKGARIEGSIQQVPNEFTLVKNDPDASSVNNRQNVKRAGSSA